MNIDVKQKENVSTVYNVGKIKKTHCRVEKSFPLLVAQRPTVCLKVLYPIPTKKSTLFSEKSSENSSKSRGALDIHYLEAVKKNDTKIAQEIIDKVAIKENPD